MELGLKGKKVILTGGSRGLGRILVKGSIREPFPPAMITTGTSSSIFWRDNSALDSAADPAQVTKSTTTLFKSNTGIKLNFFL